MAEAKATLKVGISGASEFLREIKGIKVETSDDMDAMSKSVQKSVAAMVAQYASAAALITKTTKLINEGVNFNKFVESSTTAFSVMMKSASAAKDEVQNLYDFAVKSPLTFKETVTASKQLMAYGFAVKDLIPNMEMLGTVAMATGHSLEDISYVYGTLRAQGRVYTRDLMQFGMRGIPIYEELSKVLNVPVNQIQKMTSEGKVMFSDVEQAFKNMTSEGGRFSGMMEQYMNTLQGKESMLSDIWQQDLGKLTSGLTEQVKNIVDNLTNIFSSDDFKSYLSDVGAVLGNITNIAGDLLSFIASHIGTLTDLLGIIIGLKILNALPKVLESIGTAISAIQFGTLITNLRDSITYLKLIGDTIGAVSASFAAFVAANPAIVAAVAAITVVVLAGSVALNKYKKELAEARKAAEDKLKSEKQTAATLKTVSSSWEGLSSVIGSYVSNVKSGSVSQADLTAEIKDTEAKYSALQKKVSDTKNYSVWDIFAGKSGAYSKDQKQLADYEAQLSSLREELKGAKSTGYVELLSNPNMSGWQTVIKNWADELGVARDDVAQVLYDMGKIGKAAAAMSGFTPKISTRGYSTELTTVSMLFAKEAENVSDMADDQINAMYKNAQEKIVFTTKDIYNAFNSLSFTDSDMANSFSLMLSSMGINVNNLTKDMADKFSNMFNDPNSKLTAYFEYMNTLGQETSTKIMESVANINPAIAKAMADDIKTVVSKNITIYQTALENLTKQLQTQNPGITSAQMQANDLYKLYTERMEYWIGKLPDKTRKPAKEIAEQFYQETSAYFDDWKLKLTLTGVDDMMHELQSSLQSVYDDLSKKNVAYQNAQASFTAAQANYSAVKGKGGVDESNALTTLNNAIAKMAVAGNDLQQYSAYAYQAIPEMIQYYNQQIDNLHFSELANGIDEFWNNMGGDAYRNLSSGLSGLTSKTRTLGSTFSSVGKMIIGSMEAFSKALLQGTQLGDLISAFSANTGDASFNEQTMQTQIASITTAATNALNAISSYFSGADTATASTGSGVSFHGVSSGATGVADSIVSLFSGGKVTSIMDLFASNVAGASSAASGASSAMSGVSGAAGGLLAIIIQLATAVANALANDNTWGDSAKKMVGIFDTLANAIEPFISLIMEILSGPLVEALESLGSAIGSILNVLLSGLMAFDSLMWILIVTLKVLSAVLQLVGAAFNWLYDKVIVPVGNKVIDVMNAVIKALNKLPWVHIKYIKSLKTSSELLEDVNAELENSKSALSQTIDYLTKEINDSIDDSLSSLKDLYEAGALTAEEYQAQAKALNAEKIDTSYALVSDADKALTSMNLIYARLYDLYSLQDKITNGNLSDSKAESLMKEYGISSESSQSAMMKVIKAALKEYDTVTNRGTTKTNDVTGVPEGGADTTAATPTTPTTDTSSLVDLDSIRKAAAEAAAAATVAAASNIKVPSFKVPSFKVPSFDVGTTNVSSDMLAQIHSGEGIVPTTFMDGIRSGDVALTSSDGMGSGDTYISLTVNGSVMQESDLADTIATRIYKMQKRGTATI